MLSTITVITAAKSDVLYTPGLYTRTPRGLTNIQGPQRSFSYCSLVCENREALEGTPTPPHPIPPHTQEFS